jgi:hypothetical protein
MLTSLVSLARQLLKLRSRSNWFVYCYKIRMVWMLVDACLLLVNNCPSYPIHHPRKSKWYLYDSFLQYCLRKLPLITLLCIWVLVLSILRVECYVRFKDHFVWILQQKHQPSYIHCLPISHESRFKLYATSSLPLRPSYSLFRFCEQRFCCRTCVPCGPDLRKICRQLRIQNLVICNS